MISHTLYSNLDADNGSVVDVEAGTRTTSGTRMGPKPTYRWSSLSRKNKKTMLRSVSKYPLLLKNGFLSPANKEAFHSDPWDAERDAINLDSYRSGSSFSEIHPEIDEGVLRIWGLRYYKVGGVQVIGWPRGE